MRVCTLVTVCLGLGLYNLGCDSSQPSPSGPEVQVVVAPVTLPGISEACYTLTVTNGPAGGGAVVWTKADVCSSDFGTGRGDLTYVGPCDAATGTNTVVLELTRLEASGEPDFVNPCGAPDTAPCRREVTCAANADARVAFDLTVMRSAEQGFFDVAVTFSDIFCSAKLDCSEATASGEAPLELLFGPDGGERLASVVVGLACTGGLAADTMLYWDGVALVCGDTVIPLPIAGATDGNVYGPGTTPPAPLAQVATYRGVEELTDASGTSWSQVYYNLALALDFDALPGPCDLVATATASDGPFTPPFVTPADTTYPRVRVAARLVAGATSTAYACTRHPLGRVPADLVWTDYVDGATSFDHRARASGGSVVVDHAPVGISGAAPAAFAPTRVGQSSPIAAATLSATGPGHLVVGAITTSGDFVVAGHDCAGLLAPGEGCEVDVYFTPTAAGARVGALTISSNATTSPTVLALSGTGYDTLAISPTSTSVAINGTTTFSASGGVPDYSYEVVTPGGGSFSGAVYTAPATVMSVTVRVRDALGNTSDATVTVFNPAPVIDNISPNVGVNSGGTIVGINGSNFAFGPGASVTIGGAACGSASWTPTSIQCTTPARPNGAKDVVVTNADGSSATLAGGFTYTDPEGWVAISNTGALSARYLHSAAWTGSKMLVVGGTNNGSAAMQDAALYDPATDSWSSAGNATYQAWDRSILWTGTEVIVFGGHPGFGPLFSTNQGSRYDPTSNTWTSTSQGANVPSARRGHCAVWTGTQMIVWGGYNNSDGELGDGARYTPSSNSWTTMSSAGAPSRRSRPSCAWTGSKLVVFGGSPGPGGNSNAGGVWDAATNSWTSMNVTNGPGVRDDHVTVWTGTRMLVWGGYSPFPTQPSAGASYDPGGNAWTQLSTVAAPVGRYGPVAVWTGSQMIVWGGADRDTGGVYTPATDTWVAMSTTNAPIGRNQTVAVWTGSKMIVWGGFNSTPRNTGARYTPSL